MINDFDIDMEELESRLYSQVYHGNANDFGQQNHLPNSSETATNIRQQNPRYFQTKILTRFCEDESNYIPLSDSNIINPTYTIPWKAKAQASDFFNVDSNIVNEMPVQLNNQLPQIVHMVSPHNNFIVIPQTSTQIIQHHENLESNQIKTNFKKYLHRRDQRQQKKQKKLERFKQKRNERKRLIKEQKEAENVTLNDDTKNPGFTVHYLTNNIKSNDQKINVVTISDSDDSCVEIPNYRDLIVLSSDESNIEDENMNANIIKTIESTKTAEQTPVLEAENSLDKKSIEQSLLLEIKKPLEQKTDCSSTVFSDDDVLVIDDIPKTLEIIDIDCDSKSVTNGDSSKISNKSIGSCSTNSDLKKIHLPVEKSRSSLRHRTLLSGERNELLKTPDSASNDFIDNTLDLQQKKFNFGLHGSDFGNNHTFIKPKSYTDISETESSCSASENSTPIKNSVFHEVEFEVPNKELFSESNLEAFGNYITPNRNNKLETASPSSNCGQIVTKASRKVGDHSTNFNSDSSSESDYDGDNLHLNKVKRKLSDLVHVDSDCAVNDYSNTSEKNFSVKRKLSDLVHVDSERAVNDYSNTSEKNSSETIVKKKIKSHSGEISLVNQSLLLTHKYDQLPVDSNKLDFTGNEPEVYCISDEEVDVSDTTKSKNNTELANYKTSTDASHENHNLNKLANFSKYWTTDMNKFYNTSWGREDYSVEEVQKTMSDDRKLWKIIDKDRGYISLRTPRGSRCHRCKEIGHMAVHCPNSNRSIICTLCGEIGHYEVRCPNALCTLCGSPGGYGTYCSSCANWRHIRCNICSMYGHINTKCPDLWRRYHLTTEPGPIVKPIRQTYKSTEDRWCSGCAKCGHYEYKCNLYTRSHHSVDPYVKEYIDIYNFPKTHEFVIHCNNESSRTKTDKGKNENRNNAVENLNVEFPPAVREKNINSNNKAQADQRFKEFVFPSIEMIPPYFREHVTMMDRHYNSEYLNNLNVDPNSVDSGKTSVSRDTEALHSNYPSRNAHKQTYPLNYKLFAFFCSSKGMDFTKSIQKQPHISIMISKNIDEESGGIIEMYGSFRKVKEIEHQIENFIKSAPKLENIPKFSKEIHRFLLPKLDKVEKIVGNCKALYNNLSHLQLQLVTGKGTFQTRKKIKEAKLHLNMLLFGKLQLGDGQKHMDNLQYWQKQFEENGNYKVPLNILYDLFDSYSYIFSDTVNHNYKIFCRIHNKNRYARNPVKDRKLIYRYYKLVEKKCHKFNMLDELRRLNHFRSAICQPNFSVKAFKEFMTYCHKFLHFVKTQVL